MIIVRKLRLNIGEDLSQLKKKAARELHTDIKNISEFKLIKKSLDARHKDDIHYTCSAALSISENEKAVLAKAKGPNIGEYSELNYTVPQVNPEMPPVVVGFGPGGMFTALILARAGARPIVIERGMDAVSRKKAVDAFRAGGMLDTECNVQFGEGGAGTFSDGKLNTGVKDARMRFMLGEFVKHGAPENILYDAKPHIGTDILINVVQNIRKEIISLGGEIRFSTKLTELITEGASLNGIKIVSKGEESSIPCEKLILAIGHSARDTFEALHAQGIPMERKAFSMGVRIEHKQQAVDLSQYGRVRGKLPAADYSLNVHLPDGSSAYTFCMCPGGEVIAAASEEGGICTNGMSCSGRAGENANSALLVTLHTEDFPGEGVLSGMYWQREIEQAAYKLSGSYKAPAQLIGDFLSGKKSSGSASVTPSYRPGVFWCDMHEFLPEKISSVLEKAIPELGKKLKGFDDPEAVMTGPETRSSSPVRILRGKDLCSRLSGLYPCGEGAGYAGGISSAALDGIRCAEAVISSFSGD